jgi:hypothetical protein
MLQTASVLEKMVVQITQMFVPMFLQLVSLMARVCVTLQTQPITILSSNSKIVISSMVILISVSTIRLSIMELVSVVLHFLVQLAFGIYVVVNVISSAASYIGEHHTYMINDEGK